MITFRQVRADAVRPGERMAVARCLPFRLVHASDPMQGHRRRLTLDTGDSRVLAINRLVWVREDNPVN